MEEKVDTPSQPKKRKVVNASYGALIDPSKRNQFAETPDHLYEEWNHKYHFDFDPCPKDPKFDGLTVDWGKTNFVNPPYNNILPWLQKAHTERDKGKTSVFLIPARTSNKWYHEYCKGEDVEFIKGKIKFKGYKKGAPFGSMLVTIKPKNA